MQGPLTHTTEDDEASTPTESVRDDPNMNRTVKERRKAAKHTLPWDLKEGELDLVLQEEDTPARKKPRLEEPLLATSDEVTRDAASPDVSEGLNTPAAENDDANADPVVDTPNTAATRATRRWTLEEDAKLTRAVANASKKMWGNEYKTNWPAVAALVPGRTQKQCCNRWHNGLDPSISRTSGRKGKWTAVEDSKLKDAVQTHDGKDWSAISELFPGRTRNQCWNRWHDVLDPSIDRASERKGKWTAVEDSKLKDAVQTHGKKRGWGDIVALVPGRTRVQCSNRWYNFLNPSIALTAGRKGKWEGKEDSKLKDAVQKLGDNDWGIIAALVPGRTKRQCNNRWHDALNPSITLTAGRKGKWEEDEDSKLKDAVQTHGNKDWAAISALVPGRTKRQCLSRWYHGLNPSVGRTCVVMVNEHQMKT
jgi:hypothetical protein